MSQAPFSAQLGYIIQAITGGRFYMQDFGTGDPPSGLTGFGSNGDVAINALDGEIWLKTGGVWAHTGFSRRIDNLSVGIRILPKVQYLTSTDVSGFTGLGPHTVNGQSVTFTAGDRVVSTFDNVIYIATASAWSGSTAAALVAQDAFFVGITLPDPVDQRGLSLWQYDGATLTKIGDFDFEMADTIRFTAYSPPAAGAATPVDGTGTVQDAIGELDTSIANLLVSLGILRTAQDFGSFTGFGPTGQTLVALIQSLVDRVRGESAQTNVTTAVTLDSVAKATVRTVVWDVEAIQNGNAANRYASTIKATTDGTSVNHSEYAIVELGSAITGLSFTVDISGANLRLRVSSTTAADIKSIRRTIQ